ncbi:unnamed protein product, partial [Effrenium voratum]
ESLCTSLEETSPEDLLEIPEEFRVDPSAAYANELQRSEGKSREELQQRVVELTRLLATARLHSRSRLEQALQTKTGEAELKSLQALYGALGRAEKDFDEA